MSNIVLAPSAYARDYISDNESPSGGEMLLDATAVRLPMTAVTIFGAALFVVTLPFTALGGNIEDAGSTLVVEPFKYAWLRPLGDF